MSSLGLIVKATRLCNLRCEYCYDWRAEANQTMTFETLSHLVRSALVEPGHDRVYFGWHGGEPTTLPIEFYERALWLQARYLQPRQVVSNSIMTNATLLDDTWLDFLADNRFTVGVSIDGPPEIHDAQRRDARGRATFDRVRTGLDALTDRGLDPGIIMVVDHATIERGAAALFEFVVELRVRSIGLNFAMPAAVPDATPGTTVAHYVPPPEKWKFLIELYDVWREHGDRSLSIRELDATRRRVAGHPGLVCTHGGDCFGNLFAVEPDGEVSHCSYFGGDPRYRWGNVRTSSFGQIRRSLNLAAVTRQRAAELDSMRACPERSTCLGGCPHELYAGRRHHPDHDETCCGMAPLIAHLRAHPVDGVIGGTPAVISSRSRSQLVQAPS